MPRIVPHLVALAAFAAIAGAAQGAPAPGYSVISQVPGPDGGWDLLGVDPATHRLYVARTDGVLAVDLVSGASTPHLVAGQRGHDALPIPGTTRVLETNGGANTAVIFEGATGEVVATLQVGIKPDATVYDPATRTVWVMNAGSGDASVVDVAASKVVATVPIGGSLELAAADGDGLIYVNVEDRNEVAVVDTRSRKLLRRFPLKGCDGPTGIAYAPDAKLVVSACANGVARVSAPDGREVASLAIGLRPDGAVYDAQRRLAFVPSGGDGTLSVIRLSPKPEVLTRVKTARGARTIALDPSTGRLYLPSAEYAPAVGAARPQALPGTFKILVVAPSQATAR